MDYEDSKNGEETYGGDCRDGADAYGTSLRLIALLPTIVCYRRPRGRAALTNAQRSPIT